MMREAQRRSRDHHLVGSRIPKVETQLRSGRAIATQQAAELKNNADI